MLAGGGGGNVRVLVGKITTVGFGVRVGMMRFVVGFALVAVGLVVLVSVGSRVSVEVGSIVNVAGIGVDVGSSVSVSMLSSVAVGN